MRRIRADRPTGAYLEQHARTPTGESAAYHYPQYVYTYMYLRYSREEKEPTPHNQGGLPRLAGLAVLGG